MQNPELRSKSSKETRRISIKSGSSEDFHNELAQRGSSRLIHLVKTSPRYLDPTVSSLNLTVKPRTPTFSDHDLQTRRFSENFQEKCPNKVTDLESRIFILESKLDIVKDQLISVELLKREAQNDAKDSRKQLLVLSKKFEESRKLVSDSAALFSAFDEIRFLDAESNMNSEFNQKQLQNSRLLLDELKRKTSEAKKSESLAFEIIDQSLMQIVESKVIAEILKAASFEATEVCASVASELEHSRSHVKSLEEANLSDEIEVTSLKLEVEVLKSALENARIRYDEDLFQKQQETENAVEIMKIIKFASEQRQEDLKTYIRRSKNEVDELISNLIQIETKLRSSDKKNATLGTQITCKLISQRKLDNVKTEKESIKAHMIIKEMELENAATENRALKLRIEKLNEEKHSSVIKLENNNTEIEQMNDEFEAITRTNAEMECKLRNVKMQLEQWRKAAELAASIVYAENKRNDEMQKKRNNKLMRKFGVIWKKQYK